MQEEKGRTQRKKRIKSDFIWNYGEQKQVTNNVEEKREWHWLLFYVLQQSEEDIFLLEKEKGKDIS